MVEQTAITLENAGASVTPEAWAMGMLNQLQLILNAIDASGEKSYKTPLARICNWNGLMIKLRQKGETLEPTKVKVVGKPGSEPDAGLERLLEQPAFQALALIDNVNLVLDQINPSYTRMLPRLNGLQHQLRTVLEENIGFSHDIYDPALGKVTVGLLTHDTGFVS